jgi:hypothetical protein
MRAHSANLVFTIAFVAGVFLLMRTGHASEAEAAFKARCSECHGQRDIVKWGRQRVDAAARQAWLEQVLRKHHPPTEAERVLIISHIQSVIAK